MTVDTELSFEDIYETIPGNGWLSMPEAQLLWNSARIWDGPILEVGCHHGRSTVLLSSLGRLVYAVDPFVDFDSDDREGKIAFREFNRNINERGITNIQLYKTKIEKWEPQRIGFAYLDGDHTYAGTMFQIKMAKNCAANAVCIHDYSQRGDGLHIVKAIKDSGLEVNKLVERMAYCIFK
jgi:hypothetical protein